MASPGFHDPYNILPKSFKQRHADCETVDEALRKEENKNGTTPNDVKDRCPNCCSVRIRPKFDNYEVDHKREEQYHCVGCSSHFDETRPPLSECPIERSWKWLDEQQRYREKHNKTMPMNTPFDWCTDLKDPDERGMSALFDGLDEETRTEIAIRLYKPWTDDGPSYRELAELFPHARPWIGDRVRAWKRGEYRDLVERPGPTVDDTDTEPIAADGGTRPRRWAAYGTD